jgi:hypothetical protein
MMAGAPAEDRNSISCNLTHWVVCMQAIAVYGGMYCAGDAVQAAVQVSMHCKCAAALHAQPAVSSIAHAAIERDAGIDG